MPEAKNNNEAPTLFMTTEQFQPPQELVKQLLGAMEAPCVQQVDAVVELPPEASRQYQDILLDALDKEKVGYDLLYSSGGGFILTLVRAKPYLRKVRPMGRTRFVPGVSD